MHCEPRYHLGCCGAWISFPRLTLTLVVVVVVLNHTHRLFISLSILFFSSRCRDSVICNNRGDLSCCRRVSYLAGRILLIYVQIKQWLCPLDIITHKIKSCFCWPSNFNWPWVVWLLWLWLVNIFILFKWFLIHFIGSKSSVNGTLSQFHLTKSKTRTINWKIILN